MKNIFLTGEVGTGKSTVIRKVLELLQPIVCGGFLTVSVAIEECDFMEVYIEKAWEKTPHDADHLVGTRLGHGRFTPYPQTFDSVGAQIVTSPPANASIILMDELGKMENDAPLFRQAVMDALNGPIPILGVIKPKHTDFLDAIRSHERSEVFEITGNNRETLPIRLAELLFKGISSGKRAENEFSVK